MGIVKTYVSYTVLGVAGLIACGQATMAGDLAGLSFSTAGSTLKVVTEHLPDFGNAMKNGDPGAGETGQPAVAKK